MRIGFMVNDIKTEEPGYTTIRLAMAAINMGHEAWFMGAGDFAYDPDERIHARARSVPKKAYKSSEIFLADLQGKWSKVLLFSHVQGGNGLNATKSIKGPWIQSQRC